MSPSDSKTEAQAVDTLAQNYEQLKKEIGKRIVGQEQVIRDVIISILCDSHCLLVGVPGLAKTLLVQTIANVLDLSYKRIQFTPDLMPSDITGAEIMDESRNFKFNKGPIFANIILADEINRTPPKTQAALLEAMQERSVTAAGTNYPLELPFFVLATQNPIEQEGTYPLPEAQLDRFMLNIWMDYPPHQEELQIVKETTSDKSFNLDTVLTGDEILRYQQLVRQIPIPDNVVEYAVTLAQKTRPNQGEKTPDIVKEYITWGAGPRASQYLVLGGKCHAAINGKYSPDIEDIQAIALPVLRHRIVRNYRAEAENFSIENIVDELL